MLHIKKERKVQQVAWLLLGIILLTGTAVVTGWLLGIPSVVQLFPGMVPMKFDAAVALIAAATATVLLDVCPAGGPGTVTAKILAIVTIFYGLITVVAYLLHTNFTVGDQLLNILSPPGYVYPAGKMSLLAAIQFVMVGICLLRWQVPATAVWQFSILSTVAFISSVMFVGVNFIEDAPASLKMATHLALAFILLALIVWQRQSGLHQRISYSRRLYTGFGMVLALVAIIAVYTTYNNQQRLKNSLWIRHTSEVIMELSSFMGSVTRMDDSSLPGFPGTAVTVTQIAAVNLQKIRELTKDNAAQQKLADSIAGKFVQPLPVLLSKASVRSILALAERMGQTEASLMLQRQDIAEKSIRSSNKVLFIFILFASCMLMALFMAVRRNYLIRRKSEEKFRGLLESAPDARVIVNENGIIQLVNQQTEALFGYNRVELVGKTVEVLMPEGLRNRHIKHREDFVKASRVREMGSGLELKAMRKDGSLFPVEISLAPIKTEEGPLVSASIRDITERRKAQEKITHLARLIANTAEAVFSSDATFHITSWNKAAENLFGYRENEVMGKPIAKVIRPQLSDAERMQIQAELRKAGFWKGESTYLRRNGSPLYLSVSNTVTRDARGEIDGYISVCMDYSGRKRLEEQLLQANSELEAFTYSVSHDLRAPVRAIVGFTNILETEYVNQLDEEAKRLAGIIRINTERMGNLIDDLLTFTRTSRQHIVTASIRMTDLVSELVAVVRDNHPGTEIIVTDLPDASADIAMLRQVWTNLISNAVKYSSHKQQPRIEIGGEITGSERVYHIRDNGVGFNSAYKAKLFQVFQRLHSNEEFEGTGVGLAIVEKIISKHGGRVWAESDGTTGAVFYFSLPESVKKQQS